MKIENTDLKTDSYLTPTEVAKRLQVAPVTIRKWAQKGILNAITTPGGHRRYTEKELIRFAKEYDLPYNNEFNKLRLLVVDDDLQLITYLDELFACYEDQVVVESAADGFEAGLAVHSFHPDTILLDLMMPGIDGYEVCKRVKSTPATNNIRIVAMTGLHTPETVDRIINAGAETCLAKPLERTSLLDALGISSQITNRR